jgi:hypothetical protein
MVSSSCSKPAGSRARPKEALAAETKDAPLTQLLDQEKPKAPEPRGLKSPATESAGRVEEKLGTSSLLKEDVARVKSEFRRLNLALTFTPVEGEPAPTMLSTASAT